MSTAQNLIDDVRSRIREASADFVTDAEILRWLNHGYRLFGTKVDWFEKVKAYPVVANQYEYDLPTDMRQIQQIRWNDQYTVVWRDLAEFAQFAGFSDQKSDRPYVYALHPFDKRLRIFPIPSTTSATTTVVGAHNASVTTIAVADTSSFYSRGRITIGSEQILYYDKDATHFLQCVRGEGFTTAGTYAGGETVNDARMHVRYVYTPPDMTTGGGAIDPRSPSAYDYGLIAYATAQCFMKKDKYSVAQEYMKMFKDCVDTAEKETAEKQLDRLSCIKDVNEWEVY